MSQGLRVGLVCGDGLAVSGLLTVFRNVLGLGRRLGLVHLPVATDLGYSWRPDKPAFFPAGTAEAPPWMALAGCPVDPSDAGNVGADLLAIRDGVARADELTVAERAEVRRLVAGLEPLYREHFGNWFKRNDPDWVFAVNMTLSDAVPVTAALHAAAAEHFGSGRSGGVVYWDHDLFGSCSIHDPDTGRRWYPKAPNEFTPLPADDGHTRWAVVAPGLAADAATYGTGLVPVLLPNLLPDVPSGPLERRHEEFMAQQGLDQGRPLLLDPVRVFRIKGVHIAVELLAAAKAAALRDGAPVPYLLVFGARGEDPEYGAEVTALGNSLDVSGDVRWLDGVPLTSTQDEAGRWRLDEIDLLRLARSSHGAVVFTPGVPDVETVGLGPALAAVAELPCAVTDYDVFDEVYGAGLARVRIGPGAAAIAAAAEELVHILRAASLGDARLAADLAANRAAIASRFPAEPWAAFWQELATVTR